MADGTTTSQLLAVDASGKIGVNNQPAGFDQTLPTFTSGSHSTSTRHIVAEVLPSSQAIAITASGLATQILDSGGTNKLSVDAAGGASVKQEATTTFVVAGAGGVAFPVDATGQLIVDIEPVIDGTPRLGNSFAAIISTATTTNIVASTAYLSSLAITVTTAGAGSTLTVQDKSVTPKKLVNALSGAAVSTTPTTLSFGNQGLLMTGGIDIVTAGASPMTVVVFAVYLQ